MREKPTGWWRHRSSAPPASSAAAVAAAATTGSNEEPAKCLTSAPRMAELSNSAGSILGYVS